MSPALPVGLALAAARPVPFWLDDPLRPDPTPALQDDARADLAIVGGGFAGLWAALEAVERDPGRDVVLLEGGVVGIGASGRNGGFCAATLTHGHENGASRFPEEIDEIERQGLANFRGIHEAIERHGIDAEWEETGYTSLARRPHQLEGLARAAEGFDGAGGVEARLLDRGQAQAIVRSPVVIGGLKMTGGSALIHPAKLAWGLRDAVIGLGARVYERTPVRALDESGADLVLRTDAGSVRARRVVLATNAFPPLIDGVRSRIVPVYDHVLMTEPLTPAQREAIGWTGREGLGDAANRFHYFRLSADERILWGGYDATYHFGSRTTPAFEQDDRVHRRLAANFFGFFPQLEGVRFTHRWGGVIDSCSRFSVMFATGFGGRVAASVGYTGLGVGATRFGARTCLDLVDGLETERTALRMVRQTPLPFPPEPARWLGIQATIRAYDRQDLTGRTGPWLRLLERIGLGFQS
jgi:glycine/D-amino acid oxidase-like deaminating enzyme